MPLDHLKYGERIKRKIDSVNHRIESGVRDCKRRLEEKKHEETKYFCRIRAEQTVKVLRKYV